jgi:hypothetical protein
MWRTDSGFSSRSSRKYTKVVIKNVRGFKQAELELEWPCLDAIKAHPEIRTWL